MILLLFAFCKNPNSEFGIIGDSHRFKTDNSCLYDYVGNIFIGRHIKYLKGQCIIYRIPRNSCSTCYNSELKWMSKLNYSDQRDLLIITDFVSKRDFLLLKTEISEHLKVINEYDFLPELDMFYKPYFLSVDSNGYVRSVMIAKKGKVNISKQYFNSQNIR